MEVVKIKINYHGTEKLEEIKQGDWIDLRSAYTYKLGKGDYCLMSLGVSIELPEGYEAHVVPRSSTFSKFHIILVNSFGVIDNSYNGDNDIWRFPAYAIQDTVIPKGARIAQFRIMQKQPKLELIEVNNLDNEDRGGIGSTGVY